MYAGLLLLSQSVVASKIQLILLIFVNCCPQQNVSLISLINYVFSMYGMIFEDILSLIIQLCKYVP